MFKTFPEFTDLDISHKEAYETLIKDYPPYSDLSFANLMVWWNALGACRVAMLNDNLVISYWIPGLDKHSGLALIGTNMIDESMCAIFDHLRSRGDQARLVHVPEFVMASMRYPEMFSFKDERGFDEYIIPVTRFYPLNGALAHRRWQVKRFLAKVAEDRVSIKSVDLSDSANKALFLTKARQWWKKNTINDLMKLEQESLIHSIEMADDLKLQNMAFYIDGVLRGFCIYHLPADKHYAIVAHIKVDTSIPKAMDYISYAFARWLADRGIMYVNLEYDLGLPMLRMIKLALGPTTSLRKYTVRPSMAAARLSKINSRSSWSEN